MTECPECHKKNAYLVSGKKIVCRNCGYDERILSAVAKKKVKQYE